MIMADKNQKYLLSLTDTNESKRIMQGFIFFLDFHNILKIHPCPLVIQRPDAGSRKSVNHKSPCCF